MPKQNVILIIEYDLGDYAEWFQETGIAPQDLEPSYFEESFFQSDLDLDKIKIKSFRVEEND